ncbi:MAG TPA: BMP family ABC transporter substrate-binding protein [Acidimicrobiales bacterium]|nr:BMP family ABC transporter substrate-binding protein [Acidimicrobiales bacterium]
MFNRRKGAAATVGAACVLFAVACSSSSSSSTTTTAAPATTAAASNTTAASSATTASSGAGPWGWPGDAKTGYLAPHEPDVNGDGKVVIGVISPGDTHDHGYYESFVDEANSFAKANGWQVITVDKVPDSQAAQAARNMCQQHPDMVAIAASELKDAIPVAQEAVCKDTVWYVAGGQGVTQTPYFVQTNDLESQDGYASGYAAGLLMKDAHVTKAGFITGPQVSFTTGFEKAWEVGIKAVVPNATVVTTYTGDFNDSAKAVEAYQAQKSQGIGIVYPYLGGSEFAVVGAANKDNIPALSAGTPKCSLTNPKWAISVIFDPGTYFATALGPFKNGTLRVGTALTFHMGVDPAPTVMICNPQGNDAAMLANVIHQIGTGQIRPDQLTGLNDYNGYTPSGA